MHGTELRRCGRQGTPGNSAMLELLDLDSQMSKKTCEEAFPALETRMGACQRAARAAGVPVLLVFEG
jgi:hypothetical protein